MSNLVCLDLEGTLISNAVSQIPRPGLYSFLSDLSGMAEIMLYTSVSVQRTNAIKKLLVADGCAPSWFVHMPSIHPEKTIKYRQQIPDFSSYDCILLVDDQPTVVAEGEEDWWVSVSEYLPPYPETDSELAAALNRLREYFGIL